MKHTQTSRRGFLQALGAAGAGTALLGRAERLEAALAPMDGLSFDAASPDSIRRLRDQYLLSRDLIYLNHASIGTVPIPVHQAHVGYLELCESHPSLYVWGRVWREVTENTRSAAADLLGCSPDDLAITHNTTEGFNILAHGLPLGRGDEVLFSSLNHPGASVPWRGLSDGRGFSVRSFEFPTTRGAEMTVEEVVSLHVDQIRPGTRALVIPHVDNSIGMLHPLLEIADAVRARGVQYVLVDGAQSAGMVPVDLAQSGVDAYSMSPHKWIQAPKGLGLFWAAPSLRPALPRMWFRTGGEAIERSARKYEDYSTRAWPAVVALGDALAFQAAIGESEKQRRYGALWQRIHDRAVAERALAFRSPKDPALRSMITAVEVTGVSALEVGGSLHTEHGGVVRAFGDPLNTLRLSPNLATEDTELDRFLDLMVEAGS
jgi:selenocysteine lyase/cysteine desulfurase